ncbi:MAG: hypothetical protein AAF429_06450 [Pseudomonadota bacterium]
MSEKLRSYDIARGYFNFIEMTGKITIGLAIILGLIAIGEADGFSAATQRFGGVLIMVIGGPLGLMMMGAAQYWRAGVDSAEYSQQMLAIARENLEISRQIQVSGTAKKATYKQSDPGRTKTSNKKTKSTWTEGSNKEGETVLNIEGHSVKMVGKQFEFEGKLYDTKANIEALLLERQ